jgi:cytochrome c556
MRSTATWLVGLSLVIILALGPAVADHEDLPPGPIRDRHLLMEDIGKQAEQINDALKAGAAGEQAATIETAAKALAADALQITALFPTGSLDPKSRALPAIWENWKTFEEGASSLAKSASALASSAASGDTKDIKEKARQVFSVCKSCHDQFRRPKE